jgi:hypothetical protein
MLGGGHFAAAIFDGNFLGKNCDFMFTYNVKLQVTNLWRTKHFTVTQCGPAREALKVLEMARVAPITQNQLVPAWGDIMKLPFSKCVLMLVSGNFQVTEKFAAHQWFIGSVEGSACKMRNHFSKGHQ